MLSSSQTSDVPAKGEGAHDWKSCLAAVQGPISQVHEDRGNAGGLLCEGIVVRPILLSLGIAQDLHVFLVGDVEMRPPGQPMLDPGEDRVREAPASDATRTSAQLIEMNEVKETKFLDKPGVIPTRFHSEWPSRGVPK